MSKTDPIIVVGAGHNGLTTGAYLARSGHNVLVLERRNQIGGIAATESLIPGYRFNTGFSNTATYLPKIVSDLNLHQFGFKQRRSKTAFYAAQPGGGGFAVDAKGRVTAGAPANPENASRLEAFVTFFTQMAEVFASMLPLTPPDVKGQFNVKELWPWARVALQVKGLGNREMMDFLRVLPMSMREFLDEWIADDDVRGAFSLFSTLGAHLGPLGSGTAANFLYQFTGGFAPAFAEGGAGSLSEALVKHIKAHGGSVRTDTSVEQFLIENHEMVGVRTSDGEIIPARTVVSSLDPIRTMDELVGARHLPVTYSRRMKNIRMRGSTATVHFALNQAPDFGVSAEHLNGWITMCPDLLYLEKAYDAAKYRRYAENPALLAAVPSLQDASLAPDGHHTMSVVVRYVSYQLDEEGTAGLLDAVIRTIEQYVPGFRSTIVDQVVLTPVDYTQTYGATEGAWMHGQMGLDQLLFMRPVPGWAKYHTPIQGLYLCGSGNHPGGGITGAPGMNAARELLKSLA